MKLLCIDNNAALGLLALFSLLETTLTYNINNNINKNSNNRQTPNSWHYLQNRFSGHNKLTLKYDDNDNDNDKGYFTFANQTNKEWPLVVFANPSSGGNLGFKLAQELREKLNLSESQVHILNATGPINTLKRYRNINHTILAIGGDGTVGWVLSEMDKIKYTNATLPPVIVFPLGTGNDLAQSLGLGGSCQNFQDAEKILRNINFENNHIMYLDRWTVTFNNSESVDARVALKFHEDREANKQWYNGQMKNKLHY
eukprot:Pgem_evm1s14569